MVSTHAGQIRRLSRSLLPTALFTALILNSCKLPTEQESSAIKDGPGLTDGNGGIGEQYLYAWFPGDAPVKFCIQHGGAGFSLPVAEARRAITEALADWVDAIAYQRQALEDPLHSGPLRLAAKFVESETCAADTDLVFRLGVLDEAMRQYLAYRAQLSGGTQGPPVALAIPRVLPTRTSGRIRGEIWLTPDEGPDRYSGGFPNIQVLQRFWSQKQVLFNVLLHEIGHLYGLPHDQSNVMAAHEPLTAISIKTHEQPALSAHDLFRINPLHPPDGYCKFVGLQKAELTPIVFSRYFNIENIRDVRLCIEAVSENSWSYGGTEGTYKLTFKRGTGAAAELISGPFTMSGVVRTDRKTLKSFTSEVLAYPTSVDFRGTLKLGESIYPAIIQSKSTDCKAQLAFFAEGVWEELTLYDRQVDQLCGVYFQRS